MRAFGFPAGWMSRCAAIAVAGFAAIAPAASAPVEDLFARSAKAPGALVDHSAWDRLLKQFVRPGRDGINRVDYAALKRDGRGPLDGYIARLEATDPGKLDRPGQFALLANLYNAKTVSIVLERYPVASIRDIALGGGLTAVFTGGPWQAKVLRLNGVTLSLDDVEHRIMRPLFQDPRVHYAVNCASLGCPNLATDAFDGRRLNAQLDAAARAYVNHPRAFAVQNGALSVSSIYHWYKADFGGTDQGVIAHARKYAAPALAEQLAGIAAIARHDYDWKLNDTRN